MKQVKAPKGFHWMKTKAGVRLMKHKGKYKPHKGASLFYKFKTIKTHNIPIG